MWKLKDSFWQSQKVAVICFKTSELLITFKSNSIEIIGTVGVKTAEKWKWKTGRFTWRFVEPKPVPGDDAGVVAHPHGEAKVPEVRAGRAQGVKRVRARAGRAVGVGEPPLPDDQLPLIQSELDQRVALLLDPAVHEVLHVYSTRKQKGKKNCWFNSFS